MKKIKFLLVAFILIGAINCSTTKQVTTQPLKWQKGEVKFIKTTFKNRKVKVQTNNKLEVLEETPNSYKVRFTMSSYLANNFPKGKVGEYLKDFVHQQQIPLEIEVYKDDYSTKLLNSQEWNENLEKLYKEYLTKADKENKEIADTIKKQLEEVYTNSNFEEKNQRVQILDYILATYKLEYSKNKTITKTNFVDNNMSFTFNGYETNSTKNNKKIPVKTKTYVKQQKKGDYWVITESELNYKKEVGKGLGNQVKQEIINADDVTMGMKVFGKTIVTKNDHYNWPIRIKTDKKVAMTMMGVIPASNSSTTVISIE